MLATGAISEPTGSPVCLVDPRIRATSVGTGLTIRRDQDVASAPRTRRHHKRIGHGRPSSPAVPPNYAALWARHRRRHPRDRLPRPFRPSLSLPGFCNRINTHVDDIVPRLLLRYRSSQGVEGSRREGDLLTPRSLGGSVATVAPSRRGDVGAVLGPNPLWPMNARGRRLDQEPSREQTSTKPAAVQPTPGQVPPGPRPARR